VTFGFAFVSFVFRLFLAFRQHSSSGAHLMNAQELGLR